MINTMYLPRRVRSLHSDAPKTGSSQCLVCVVSFGSVFLSHIKKDWSKVHSKKAYFQGRRYDKSPLQDIWWKNAPNKHNIPEIDQHFRHFFTCKQRCETRQIFSSKYGLVNNGKKKPFLTEFSRVLCRRHPNLSTPTRPGVDGRSVFYLLDVYYIVIATDRVTKTH